MIDEIIKRYGKEYKKCFDEELCIDLISNKEIYNALDKKYKGCSFKKIREMNLSKIESDLAKTYIYLNSKYNYINYFSNGFDKEKIIKYIDEFNYCGTKLMNKFIKLYNDTKDQKIKDIIIYSNQFLIFKCLMNKTDDMDLFEELVQVSNLTLLKSLEKYEINLVYPFNMYASWFIRKKVNMFMAHNENIVYRGVNKLLFNKDVINYIKDYELLYSKYPSYEEMYLKFGISKERYISIYNSYNVFSLNDETNIMNDEYELIDDIDDNINFTEFCDDKFLWNTFLSIAKESLSKAQYNVFINSIKGIGEKTFEEIGNELNISKQAAHCDYKRALDKLREDKKIKKLLNRQ